MTSENLQVFGKETKLYYSTSPSLSLIGGSHFSYLFPTVPTITLAPAFSHLVLLSSAPCQPLEIVSFVVTFLALLCFSPSVPSVYALFLAFPTQPPCSLSPIHAGCFFFQFCSLCFFSCLISGSHFSPIRPSGCHMTSAIPRWLAIQSLRQQIAYQ